MSQKIIRIGSSLGATLPKRLLDKLNLKLSDEIELSYNPRRETIEILAIKPVTKKVDSLFSEIKQIVDEHQADFAKLED